jgi:hypothetical protein
MSALHEFNPGASRLLFVSLQQAYVQIAMVFEPGLVTLDGQHTDSRKQLSALGRCAPR